MKTVSYAVLFLTVFALPLSGQQVDSVRAVLGAEYDAGALRTFVTGHHWRDAWTTPFTVPVLNLETYAGGLQPRKEGGGQQSRTLYLRTKEGHDFKFRAINTDPSHLWRTDIRKAIITKAMLDQITTLLPFAPVVASELEQAVGLETSPPQICAMPDSPLLGEYRETFAGLVGTLERHPEEHSDVEVSYLGAERITSTYTLLAALEQEVGVRVDEITFCKARLMDVLLGDWDRHAGQWRWVQDRDTEGMGWRPIPRDRDQAFSLFDGLLPTLVERGVRPLQSYDTEFPSLRKLTWTGRHLDRRLLSSVTRRQWDSLAVFIVESVTDSVLQRAVLRLPPEWHTTVSPRLLDLLLLRRAELPDLARSYYELVAGTVDIRGSAGADVAVVQRHPDGAVTVELRDARSEVSYLRSFRADETDELRIHGLAGDDSVLVIGEAGHSIDVRVIGGAGEDVLIDRSHVRGYFWYLSPIPRAEHCTFFYDDDENSHVELGSGTSFNGKETLSSDAAADRYEPLTEDRGGELHFDPRLTYNSDDGLLAGGGPVYTHYGFRHDPFAWRLGISAAYASTPADMQLEIDGQYYSIVPGVMLHMSLFHSELSLGRFYGYGNETQRDQERETMDYYRIDQELIDVRAALCFASSEDLTFEMGAAYRYSEVDYDEGSFFAQDPQYGKGDFKYGEIFGIISFDTRDDENLPMRGAYCTLTGRYFPVAMSNSNQFADGALDLRVYLPVLSELTLALRGKGRNLWGSYPFYHAAYLGGKSDLRGFSRERFAGDASMLGSAELRLAAGPVRLFFPGEWGLLTFYNAGRVFFHGEESTILHSAWGGGIWVGLINKRLALSVMAARSAERFALYISTGFTF